MRERFELGSRRPTIVERRRRYDVSPNYLNDATPDYLFSVRLWRLDDANTEQEYPFVCDAVLQTGHRGNIFNAQLLPHSSRM